MVNKIGQAPPLALYGASGKAVPIPSLLSNDNDSSTQWVTMDDYGHLRWHMIVCDRRWPPVADDNRIAAVIRSGFVSKSFIACTEAFNMQVYSGAIG
ncbi:hypothetical protein EVAR_66357_1 [Eumeta japonica]|uniref:Uncharacterized protein n=1 Tax=Eumeta variegata TaxID=151549 RepID=A0A4C1ZT95_EUMVA|nr:hypothetical protein EVAR_66357_1 [Eumeta japonica]